MSYTYGFFDAVDLGGGNFDRVYSSAEFSHYWALLVGDGVFGQPSTSLNVLAMEPVAMRVKVAPGTGWIKGHYLTVPDNMDEVILVPVANPSLPRIDSIIMALNNADRDMKLYLRSGTTAASPKPVTLQRDADVWELELAQITVAAGAGNISQTAIKDMRPDPNRCGIVTGLIDQFDVSGFFTAAQASFNEWFEEVRGQLGEDVAGNLFNLIQGVDSRVTILDNQFENKTKEIGESLVGINSRLNSDLGKIKNSRGNLVPHSSFLSLLNVSNYQSTPNGWFISPSGKKILQVGGVSESPYGTTLTLWNTETGDKAKTLTITHPFQSRNTYSTVMFMDDDILILAFPMNNDGNSYTVGIYRVSDFSLDTIKDNQAISAYNLCSFSSRRLGKSDPTWAFFVVVSNRQSNTFNVYKYNKITTDLSLANSVVLDTSSLFYPESGYTCWGDMCLVTLCPGTNNVSPITRKYKNLIVDHSGQITVLEEGTATGWNGYQNLAPTQEGLCYGFKEIGETSYVYEVIDFNTKRRVSQVSTTDTTSSVSDLLIWGDNLWKLKSWKYYILDKQTFSSKNIPGGLSAISPWSVDSIHGLSPSSTQKEVFPEPLGRLFASFNYDNNYVYQGNYMEVGGPLL